jgi:hypothetical protein
MANSLMPTRIEQINNFAGRAYDKLIDVHASQAPLISGLAKILGEVTVANDSDQMAKAAAIQDIMVGNGDGPEKIRAALAKAGFRAGIVGSKELQDRYEEAEATRMAKEMHDNTVRVTGMMEEAKRLAGDLALFKQEVPGGEHIWYQRNKDKLQKNPYAMEAISTALANSDISTPAKLLSAQDLIGLTPTAVREKLNSVESRLATLAAMGIPITDNPEEALKHTNFDAYVKDLIKELGYEKDAGGAGDIRKNFYGFYNKAKGKYKNAPDDLIIAAARQFFDSELFPWDQEDVDEGPALEWIGAKLADGSWNKNMNQARELNKVKKIIKESFDNDSVMKAQANLTTMMNRLRTAPITELEKQMALSKQISGYNTLLQQLAVALKDADSALARSIN